MLANKIEILDQKLSSYQIAPKFIEANLCHEHSNFEYHFKLLYESFWVGGVILNISGYV